MKICAADRRRPWYSSTQIYSLFCSSLFSSGPGGEFSVRLRRQVSKFTNADHGGRDIAGGPVNHLDGDLYSVNNDGVIGPMLLSAIVTIFRVVRR